MQVNRHTRPLQRTAPAGTQAAAAMAEGLGNFLRRYRRLAVVSGAGCSTASGIPDYRDESGNWKYREPLQFADFIGVPAARQRYWAQSLAGWQRIAAARPNAAHRALAALERAGRMTGLITQNVDNLHRLAGSCNVVDLHGLLQRIRCLECQVSRPREEFQEQLRCLNPDWEVTVRGYAPDGDAELDTAVFQHFVVPDCDGCGGILKPDVVFFGEAVPAERVNAAIRHVDDCDALLIVGSSLMVFSGYRFARLAHAAGKPVAIVNRGKTRADDLASCKFHADCSSLLEAGVAAVL